VIPDLGGIVEHAGLVGLAGGFENDALKRLAFKRRAGNELVEIVDVGLVVLAVVEAQGIGADDRVQRIVGIRQGRKADDLAYGCLAVGLIAGTPARTGTS
jgi:hypothetical protein